MAEMDTMGVPGHSRREVIKGVLRATAYAAPVILGATVARTDVAAATPAPVTGAPVPGTLAVAQIPPDEICEGAGLPPPVLMPVQVTVALVGALANTAFQIYVLPTAFIPTTPSPGTYTLVGTIATNAAGAANFDRTVNVSIPAQKILMLTVNFVRAGDAPQVAVYSKTLMPNTFCD